MEESLLDIPLSLTKPEKITIIKGVSERLNYYIPRKESSIYDLRYNFPLNYFNGTSACLKFMMKNMDDRRPQASIYNKRTRDFRIRTHKHSQLNELKFSAYNNKMLGISKQQYATMYLTYSYMDL